MKMESGENKLSTSKTDAVNSAGKLTFGPAWLRQLSSGDTNKTQLPPSPGLTFQLSKYRYSREEMLAIYENIEHNLPIPKALEDFEDLLKRDTQKPVLLIPSSLEEQKLLSTCVNSNAALNSYNKSQVPLNSSTTNQRVHMSTSNATANPSTGSSGIRGNNTGQSIRAGSNSGPKSAINVGNSNPSGRGRGRSRAIDSSSLQHNYKADDEGGATRTSNDGPNRKLYAKHTSTYTTRNVNANWDEREGNNTIKTRASNEDSWRKPGVNPSNQENDSDNEVAVDEADDSSRANELPPSSAVSNEEEKPSSNKNGEWRQSGSERKEWNNMKTTKFSQMLGGTAGDKKPSDKRNFVVPNEREPEWLDDDNDVEDGMTFDERGQFISVKKLKERKDDGPKRTTKQSSTNNSIENKAEEVNNANTVVVDANKKEKKSVEAVKPQEPQQALTEPVVVSTPSPIIQPNQQQSNISEHTTSKIKDQPRPDDKIEFTENLTKEEPFQIGTRNITKEQVDVNVKSGSVPLNHPDAEKWLYLDPQNQIQGTFTSEEMAGWFAAGYFTLNLMIRRGCDDQFLPLGMVLKAWGRLPFLPGPQLPPLKSKDPLTIQLMQQLQTFQQMQLIPNQNVYRPELLQQQSVDNLKDQLSLQNIIQQQQSVPDFLQKQQQEAYLNRLLMKQAAVLQATMQQQQQQQQQTVQDPAILNAAISVQTKSIWGDAATANKIKYSNAAATAPIGRNDVVSANAASLLQQANLLAAVASSNLTQQSFIGNAGMNAVNNQMLSDNLTDKIQAFFEQTKKEEERRIQQEEDLKLKLMKEEEEARMKLEEMRLREEEELMKKRLAEERLREELRKEEQRRRLEEIIRKQEEDRSKKIDVEIKRKKDEESRQKLENLKRKEELRRLELEKRQQEELEQKRIAEKQQSEYLFKKQLEAEKQKQQKLQEELNSIQLPAHANWAKANNSINTNSLSNQAQYQQISLKWILEQQAIESMEKQRQLIEQHQKQQAEMAASQSNTWSSLFRGQQHSMTSLADIQNEQAANYDTQASKQESNSNKYYQQQKQQQANLAKILSKPSQGSSWNAWGSSASQSPTNDLANTQFPLPVLSTSSTSINQPTPFWTDVGEKKQQTQNSKPASLNKNQVSNYQQQQQQQTNTSAKHIKDVEKNAKNMFRKSFTISDDFMKWCHEQLKDFHADLHIPTFVNFLLEIDTCNEIEEYVCNYLGDIPQAKEFAQHFYINRENQISTNYNYGQAHNKQTFTSNSNNGNNTAYTEVHGAKKKQKKKGQPVDLQLLGFSVQSDPTLTNRGGIDQI